MASRQKGKQANSVRNILREMGDPFDTRRIYELVHHFFTTLKRGGGAARLLGQEYRFFTTLQNTPQLKTLVRNIVMLRAMHITQKQITTLLNEGTDAKIFDQMFKDAMSFYRVQHEASGYMLTNAETIRQRIVDKGMKNFLFSENFPTKPTAIPPALMDVRVPPITALHNLDQLRKLEDQPENLENSPDAQAEYACNLFELGCYDKARRMVADILKTNPWHGMTNYVAAMLHTAEAHLDARIAGEKEFLSEITSDDGEGFATDALADEALQHQGKAAYHRQQALVQYLIALKHWPKHQGYFDHSRRRRQVVQFTLQVLASWSHGKGEGEGLGLQKLLPTDLANRKDIPNLAAWTLDILKMEEPNCYAGGLGQRAVNDLCWLQLYWVLDAAEYKRFSKEWLKRIESYLRPDLEAVAHKAEFHEHLRRLVPDFEARRRQLHEFEARCHEAVTFDWQHITEKVLTTEMIACYRQRKLEDAMKLAKEIVTRWNNNPRAIYDHIRILYDLSRAALKSDDIISASKWLCQIMAEYPEFYDLLGGMGYLHEVGEDDYEDTFGNGVDILEVEVHAGHDDVKGCPEPLRTNGRQIHVKWPEPMPKESDETWTLERLVRILLKDARVGEADRAKMNLLLKQLKKGGGAMH